MSKVRMGLIGLGNMGNVHRGYFNKVDGLVFAAAADLSEEKRKSVLNDHKGVELYESGVELIEKADLDAVLIATPHYDHVPLSIAAMKKGFHVLLEKPIAVTAKAAEEVIEAHKAYPHLKFGAMFQQRTDPQMRKVKSMLQNGTLGEVRRVTWLITNWFRSQRYYDSGGWRATWAGEGGGVLLNQCPHNLDLITWFLGSPVAVTARGSIGRFHKIEVEDDMHAILEYESGAMGHFITTTGEAPGTNRLEIAGDKGKLVVEGGEMTFIENEIPCQEWLDTTEQAFGVPPTTTYTIKCQGKMSGHQGITQNFVNAILKGEELIAPAEEGIRGLELGNAMLMSALRKTTIEIPTPRDEFDAMLKDLAARSSFKKEVNAPAKVDMAASSS